MTMGEIVSLTLCLPFNPFSKVHVKLLNDAITNFFPHKNHINIILKA